MPAIGHLPKRARSGCGREAMQSCCCCFPISRGPENVIGRSDDMFAEIIGPARHRHPFQQPVTDRQLLAKKRIFKAEGCNSRTNTVPRYRMTSGPPRPLEAHRRSGVSQRHVSRKWQSVIKRKSYSSTKLCCGPSPPSVARVIGGLSLLLAKAPLSA